MAKGSGGSGRGGGGGPAANAAGGTVRTINGTRFNTADVVNRALTTGRNDESAARAALERLGNRTPAPEQVRQYATQARVLGNIQRMTGASAAGQIGKWNFSSASTILSSFESYLGRRTQGQHVRWLGKQAARR